MLTKKDKIFCTVSFFIACAALFFSGGRYGIAPTVFIWPAAFLFCVRRIKKNIFPAVLFAVMAAVNSVKLLGLSGSSAAVDVAEAVLVTVVQFLPLLAEYIISGRDKAGTFWNNPLRSLIFPAFYSGFSVLFCLSFMSATCSAAYTLGGFAPAEKAVSVVGIFGLLFLITWFASLLERTVSFLISGERFRLKKDIIIFIPVLVCSVAAGYITSALQPVDYSPTVRIAAAVGVEQPVDENGEYPMLPIEACTASLDKTISEAGRQNAEILVYNEEAYPVYDFDVERFTAFACEKAREYKMYVFLPLDVSASNEEDLCENCIKLITPDGKVEYTYEKSRLVPAIETEYRKGDGIIPVSVLEFPDGRKVKTAAFICYDGDSPLYINSIAPDVDVLISPSWDWEGITYYHTPAMTFRALENGASLVKPTYDGISAICDCSGNRLLSFNSFETGFDHVETADVPLKGITTAYALVFSHLDFLYIVLPEIFCVLLFVDKKKKTEAK